MSEGGIARGRNAGYPAILHGTEAVVPLPDGNKIPVEMKNGGAGSNITNNITVNISKEGSASTTTEMTGTEDSTEGKKLGRLISNAIQEELIKQQRPGGILSPMGA